METLDLLLVNPGGRDVIYQSLSNDLAAVEPPLWCRLIGGYARDRGHTVAIVDSEALNWGPQTLAACIAERKPRLVCVVAFGHQPSASTQQMVGARAACEAIKAVLPDQDILIVGGHVSALPERTLREESATYACKGEGPVTVDELLKALSQPEDQRDLGAVPGLVWWKDGDVAVNPAAPLTKDMDEDLHGTVWDLLPMEAYRAHNWQCFGDLSRRQPYASVYTSLGCPYKCVFCCINAPFDTNRYRMRSPQAVIAEIDHLYTTYGVKTFKIIDEMFVLNHRHVREICEGLAAKPYAHELNLWAYARIDTVKEDMLGLLRSAGIRWLALGIESGSEHVRDGADKSFSEDEIRDIVGKIQKSGIAVIGNFIFGLPDDDMTSMRRTLDVAKDLNCEFINFYSAMAYPGSQLYALATEHGWELPASWSGFSQHSYDCTPLPTGKISGAEVLAFRDAAFHEYFENSRYLDMITQRFGQETRRHIQDMAKTRLRRKLVEETAAAQEAAHDAAP